MEFDLPLGPVRYAAAFILSLLFALYLTPIVRRGAIRYGVVDQPDGRLKEHQQPVPYLGGIAVYLAFLFAVAFTYEFNAEVLGFLLAGSIVVTLGLFDDLRVLRPWPKLLGQLVAALVLLKSGIYIRLTFLPEAIAVLVTLVWMVGLTNATNLIDVSDGLAAGVAIIAGGALLVVALLNQQTTIALLTLSLMGALLGFLVYNRPPASIFLGDAGAMFIGFMLAALAMSGRYTERGPMGALAPVIILGTPIFDLVFVVVARRLRGTPIMHGSPDHFAVRLRHHGWNARGIALVAYVATAFFGAVGVVVARTRMVHATVAIAVLAVGVTAAVWYLVRRPPRHGVGPSESSAQRLRKTPTSAPWIERESEDTEHTV
jgi:UDP-GlcNAc:undecaprenyl-phosphate/decaprenyl-phosphate GlcNAc-1-phosphate transferase